MNYSKSNKYPHIIYIYFIIQAQNSYKMFDFPHTFDNNNNQLPKIMILQEEEQSLTDMITPFIKFIKDRQELYFATLSFTKKNIDSSSNDFDQISIFNNFLTQARTNQKLLQNKQTQFLVQFKLYTNEDGQIEGKKIPSNNQEMHRLLDRVLEILESSVEKTRNSIFGQKGKLSTDFSRMRKSLHQVSKKQQTDMYEFFSTILNFCRRKFRKQIGRLQSYSKKLEQGDQISLKDMYNVKEGSDISVSPTQKLDKHKHFSLKRPAKHDQSASQSPQRKASTKKVLNPIMKPKRTLNLKASKRDDSVGSDKLPVKQKSGKQKKAKELLNFYKMLQLNKKEFLQDYIFQKQEEQQQKKRLMNELLEKNKKNSEQISTYFKRVEHYHPSIHQLGTSSDENQTVVRNESSGGSRISLKTSFIISKRKPSFSFDSPSTDKSDVQFLKSELPQSRTIRNIHATSSKKRTTNSTSVSRANNQKTNSKKIFVVKKPMNFEDEVIPQANLTQGQWIQTPLTGKDRSRKNQELRWKRRNNPVPLDNTCLPQTFNGMQYPL